MTEWEWKWNTLHRIFLLPNLLDVQIDAMKHFTKFRSVKLKCTDPVPIFSLNRSNIHRIIMNMSSGTFFVQSSWWIDAISISAQNTDKQIEWIKWIRQSAEQNYFSKPSNLLRFEFVSFLLLNRNENHFHGCSFHWQRNCLTNILDTI